MSTRCSKAKSDVSNMDDRKGCLKRFALIVDGMTRASLLPQGPYLVYHMIMLLDATGTTTSTTTTALNTNNLQLATWRSVVYLLAWILSVFAIGRSFGAFVATRHCSLKHSSRNHNNNIVARLGGLALVLLYTTATIEEGEERTTTGSISTSTGYFSNSFRWLLVLRFVSAALASFLTTTTQSIVLPEDARSSEESTRNNNKNHGGRTTTTAVKLYVLGFALPILVQCFRLGKNNLNPKPSATSLLSPPQLHVSTLFSSLVWFLAMTVIMELLLRTAFSLCSGSLSSSSPSSHHSLEEPLEQHTATTTAMPYKCRSRLGSASLVKKQQGHHSVRMDVDHASDLEEEEDLDRFTTSSIHSSSRYHVSHNGNNNNNSNHNHSNNNLTSYHFEIMNSSLRSRKESIDNHFPASVRSRMESYTSLDEFFDCRSFLSDVEDVLPLHSSDHGYDDDNNNNNLDDMDDADVGVDDDDNNPLDLYNHHYHHHHQIKVAKYVNHQCVYEDGSCAYVPPGESPCQIPSTYLEFYKGNHIRAQEAWEETQRWRCEKQVWRILALPNPWFAKIKQAYPHFVHGHSKAGFPIIYEQPGKMELKRLFAEGCSVEDMLYHYTFFMEFISNIVCTRDELRSMQFNQQLQAAEQGHELHTTTTALSLPPHSSATWGIVVVMDVKGAGLSQLSGNVAMYVKKAGDINSAHYPTSMKRAFLINAPFWLGGAWSGIKSLLPDSVQVDILSERSYLSALQEYIDDDQIPPEYGGTSPYSLGQHPYEVELRNLIDTLDRQAAATASTTKVDECFDDTGPPQFISTSSPASADSCASVDGKGSRDQVPALLSDHSAAPLALASATLTNVGTTTAGAGNSSSSGLLPLRRRIQSVDRHPKSSGSMVDDRLWKVPKKQTPSLSSSKASEIHSLAFASSLYASFNAIQAALELFLPLWLLSPTSYGGLGVFPQRSCVVMFCSTFVLLWVSRRNPFATTALQFLQKFPLRTFRISVGTESILLAALALVTFKTPASERIDSVFLTTTIILIFAGVAFAGTLGRLSAASLHLSCASNFASCRLAKLSTSAVATSTTSFASCLHHFRYNWQYFLADCESGRFTSLLSPVTEVVGVFSAAPLLCWFVSYNWLAPFTGSAFLLLCSVLALMLYVVSSSQYGAKHDIPSSLRRCACGYYYDRPRNDRSRPSCLPCIGEAVSVSTGDVASLLEEGHWSSTPMLGRSLSQTRGRAFSDVTSSVVLFSPASSSSNNGRNAMMMERGEPLQK